MYSLSYEEIYTCTTCTHHQIIIICSATKDLLSCFHVWVKHNLYLHVVTVKYMYIHITIASFSDTKGKRSLGTRLALF